MTADHTETDWEGKAPQRVSTDWTHRPTEYLTVGEPDRPPTLAELVDAIDRARDAWRAAVDNVAYHERELAAARKRTDASRDALELTLARYDADRNQATT